MCKDGNYEFKETHVVQSKGNKTFNKQVKNAFLVELLVNVKQRFPDNDSNLLSALGVLGLRPITFVPVNELDTWRNDKIANIVQHYGQEKRRGEAAAKYLLMLRKP